MYVYVCVFVYMYLCILASAFHYINHYGDRRTSPDINYGLQLKGSPVIIRQLVNALVISINL